MRREEEEATVMSTADGVVREPRFRALVAAAMEEQVQREEEEEVMLLAADRNGGAGAGEGGLSIHPKLRGFLSLAFPFELSN